jgi:hypothetical protein
MSASQEGLPGPGLLSGQREGAGRGSFIYFNSECELAAGVGVATFAPSPLIPAF